MFLLTMLIDRKLSKSQLSKMHGRGVARAGKGIICHFKWRYGWNYSNQRSLEHSSLLINKVDITVKHEIKQQKGGFMGTLLLTLGIF